MPSRMSFSNSPCKGRRATPTTENSSGNRFDCSRWKSAGKSLRLVRSPEAPKITTAVGSGIRSALCAAFRSSGVNFTSIVAMALAPSLTLGWLCPYAAAQAQTLERLRTLTFILILDCMDSQTFSCCAVPGTVIDESHFFRIPLQHIQRQLKNFGVWLAQPQVAGT